LKFIAREPPRIVVLDLMMPGIGGREILAFIKANHPQIGVILLTGHGCVAPEGDPFAAELCDLLVKPVNIDELIRKIRSAAGQKPDTGGWKSDGG
jgi:DNA-binding NtrC family response regulator